jgi:hypothetical protein
MLPRLTGRAGKYPTRGQLPGATTNDSAAAGMVGEFGISVATNATATITMTIATPAVVTWTAHGFSNDSPCPVVFTTTGALPTGVTAGTTYWTVPGTVTANTFQFATSIANALAATSVNTTGSQSGVQTGTSRIALTTNVGLTYAAVLLTAGDWDLDGSLAFNLGASTNVTYVAGSISLVIDTFDASSGIGVSQLYGAGEVLGNAITLQFAFPTRQIKVANGATTLVYASVIAGFTVSTAAVSGTLRKRRMR